MNKEEIKIAIVMSNFNQEISSNLLENFYDHARNINFPEKNITLYNVPGAFEIPYMVKRVALTEKFNAIVCLGSLIRGETIHFEIIASELAHGISQISRQHLLPVIFGVLTVNNLKQANARIFKAAEFLDTALSMINVSEEFLRP